jgi:hypothetical protein
VAKDPLAFPFFQDASDERREAFVIEASRRAGRFRVVCHGKAHWRGLIFSSW